MFHEHGTSWFLAQLKPNCANIADKHLKRQGFQTFLPLQEVTRRRNDKFFTIERPLFPGYIFVAFDPTQGLWRKVKSTFGISRLVSFGKAPTVVPKDLVSEIMQRCDDSSKQRIPNRLKFGDQVTITKGPFASFVAEIEKIAPDRRVWVLMKIMGGQTRVAVSAEQLTMASTNAVSEL